MIFLQIKRKSIGYTLFLIVLFFTSLISINAQPKKTEKVTIKVKDRPIENVFVEITRQTGVKFFYSNATLSKIKHVTFTFSNIALSDVLDQITKKTNLYFNRIDNTISVSLEKIVEERAIEPTPKTRTITGIITDESGVPVIGASIVVKGISNGTISDSNGYYSISNVAPSSVLTFSYIGLRSENVKIAAQNQVNVTLCELSIELSEIVAIGYGTMLKRDLTGSIAGINYKDIRLMPIVSVDQALQGKIPGVQIVQSNGAPGGAVQVHVRGINSTSGGGVNQPLYVVDGIPIVFNETEQNFGLGFEGISGGAASNGSSPLSTINPNDIESLEVLKDASASAIYGARAANGVILITTKTGKIGKTKINLDSYYGLQNIMKNIPLTNARERAQLVFEHRRNAGTRFAEGYEFLAANPYLLEEGTNWVNEVFRTAPTKNVALSANGGNDKFLFAVSADYQKQDGIVINTYSERLSTRVNLDVIASPKLKFGTRSSFSFQKTNQIDNDEFNQGSLLGLSVLSPLLPVYDSQGNFAGTPFIMYNGSGQNISVGSGLASEGFGNIVANILSKKRNANRYRINSSLFAEYKILAWLKFKSSFSTDYLFSDLFSFDPLWTRGAQTEPNMKVSQNSPKSINWLAEQLLTFSKKMKKHDLNAILGFSAQQFTDFYFGAQANGSTSNALDQFWNQTNYTNISGGQVNAALLSQYGRVNYIYNDKYLLTSTLRRDGSSRFGTNYKYGFFPSFSGGWRISQENFFKKIKFINNLKLRVSYGVTGSQNIDNFLYMATMSSANTVFGNTIVPGVAPSRFENEDIHWEQNKQFDVGFDLGFWNNRISITADYYAKRTDGLLATSPISVISGVGGSVIRNIGIVDNKGFEFAINTVIFEGKFRWTTEFNISTNQNKVVNLGSLPYINGASIGRINAYTNTGQWINRTEVGHPIGGFYVILQNEKQITSWEEAATMPLPGGMGGVSFLMPGDYGWVDQKTVDSDGDGNPDKGDGKIDDNDRVWVGSPFPDFFGGLTNTFSYKGFSLSTLLSFQYGNKLWNQPRLVSEFGEGNMWRSSFENRYDPTNPNVQTSVPIIRTNNPLPPSNRFLEDASYIRLRNITLAYEIPIKIIEKIKLDRLKVYVQANNLFTLTKYTGWDPEANSFGSNVITNGIDIGAYPQAKSIVFGLNIGF